MTNLFNTLFPQVNREFQYVNLAEEAALHYDNEDEDLHTFLNKFPYTYGGYGEDRALLWINTYLKDRPEVIHLGLDIQAPAGTLIHSPVNGFVAYIEEDGDRDLGWGTKVILKDKDRGVYWIFGHLGYTKLWTGNSIAIGDKIGLVGNWDNNGGVFFHLHTQIHLGTLESAKKIDGYGGKKDLINNPNPLEVY